MPQATAEAFGEPGRQRRGLLHRPCEPGGQTGLVMCPPFGEERKAAARVMTLAAAAWAERGYPVLRFDYFGTGESDGWMEEATLDDWLGDIGAAVEHLMTRTGVREVGLLGLRFGATLAALCESSQRPPACLVLWDPQMTGGQTLAECRRHLAATRLVAGPVSAERSGCDESDMGGFVLSESLGRRIESICLPADARARVPRVVVVQFSSRSRVSPVHWDLCKTLTAPDGASRALCLPVRPFWVTASRFDPRSVVDRSVLALEELAALAAAGGPSA